MISEPYIYQPALDQNPFQFPQLPGKFPAPYGLYHDLSNELKQYLIDLSVIIVNTLFKCDARATAPTASLREFVSSLIHYSKVPTNNILCALLYLVRLKRRHPECKGTNGAGFRLFLAALIVSNKYLYDNPYHNQSWAKMSGGQFTLHDIGLMEFELLYLLSFNLNVTKEQWVNFVELIDVKVTATWGKYSHAVPKRFLYSKATAGIDAALGKSSRLPDLMRMAPFRGKQRCSEPTDTFTPFSRRYATSVNSNDSGPKTPDY
ncbi:hypothetical protein K493DRAFT_340022 [Basidiobolus meristosporus CBS 931.73]|uniref:Cyclin N-terminal domain-containing protein n=1 Tax=Basidiobolus meristosporus CBS 931.73 TaxID=1314790 RepID=A0A1Y1XXN8_9FUNG|nr:hypothetical protein K493DRAFT_340022 [Basidiobolus meristosporus CBS 931.73]|eukprot:ORX90415.1 hypothetical protein K493DRAFT_340022 [Basidiobolus meristosporus CBS 931.73]